MYKKIGWTILFFLLLLSPLPSWAVRQTEISYPPGPEDIETPVHIRAGLPDYIKYVFWFVIGISGLVCFFSMIYAGFLFITSAGKPAQQKAAKDKILMAFLGAVVTLSSWLLANTINPRLVILEAPVRPVGGITIYSKSDCEGEEMVINQNTPDLGFDGGAKSLSFISPPGQLQVQLYSEKNYVNPFQVINSKYKEDCYSFSQPARSIEFFYRLPGVYLCTEEYEWNEGLQRYLCPGEEAVNRYDTSLLREEINDKVKEILILPHTKTVIWVLGEDYHRRAELCREMKEGQYTEREGTGYCTYPTLRYVAVLHEHADMTGQGELFVTGREKLKDAKVIKEDMASSLTVMLTNWEIAEDESGVWLCEDPDAQRGDDGCYGPFKNNFVLDTEDFSYEGISYSIDHNSISSIIIDGDYTAALFENTNFEGKCQVFKSSDSNLRDDPIGRCNCLLGRWGCKDCLDSFVIIPTLKEHIEPR